MRRHDETLRARAARLGRVALGLVVLSLLLFLGAAIVLLVSPADRVQPTLPLGLAEDLPTVPVLIAAGLGLAGCFVGFAAFDTATAMRVLSPLRQLPRHLAPWARRSRSLVLGAGVGRMALDELPDWPATALPPADELAVDRVRVTVLVPAHDEAAVIAATLTSLAAQRRPPDRVVVIADNCTDTTADIARAHGVEVHETVSNAEKKAGALNQVLETLLPDAGPEDVVLVMDADSTISEDYLAVGLGLLEDDPDLIAVSGLFFGEEGGGLVGQLQRNEYTRYQRTVTRRPERVFVLTGTASLIRAYALRAVAEARGPLVPGPPGRVYDTVAMTEDNELTMALKTLGAKMYAPPQCVVTTEVMTSWRDLWRQRLRWHRGALENIGVYGLTRASGVYWSQQAGLCYGVLAFLSYLTLFTVTALSFETMRWSAFWIAVGCVFLVERLVTVWPAGWRARLIAAPMLIELAYALFLQVCFVASLAQIWRGTKADWNYVPRSAAASGVLLPAVVAHGIVFPESVLHSGWYAALATWVGFNTIVYAALSVVSLFPPLPRPRTREARAAIRRVAGSVGQPDVRSVR